MANKYLNQTGLDYFWKKLKLKFADITHTHLPSEVGAVPTTRTVNSKALSANVTLTAVDVGANTTSINATLSTIWTGVGPFTKNVTIAGMTASKNAVVGLAPTATVTQRAVARDAILSVTAQTTNRITITADGDKPTITIPITVILMP